MWVKKRVFAIQGGFDGRSVSSTVLSGAGTHRSCIRSIQSRIELTAMRTLSRRPTYSGKRPDNTRGTILRPERPTPSSAARYLHGEEGIESENGGCPLGMRTMYV